MTPPPQMENEEFCKHGKSVSVQLAGWIATPVTDCIADHLCRHLGIVLLHSSQGPGQ